MRRLVVLRPEPGASHSCERARALGLEALARPLFTVVPLDWVPPPAGQFDAVLLTSANALRHGGPGLAGLRRLPAYAVGAATASAAEQAGFTVAMTGEGDVDSLLAAMPAGLRLVHPCGAERRQPSEPAQAIVALPVYRSIPLPDPLGEGELAGAVAAVHSPRAAARLGELVVGPGRAGTAIAAISPAAASAAGAGWAHVEAAAKPSDSELLALAARLCNNGAEQ